MKWWYQVMSEQALQLAKHMSLTYSSFFVVFFHRNKHSPYLKVHWPFFQGKRYVWLLFFMTFCLFIIIKNQFLTGELFCSSPFSSNLSSCFSKTFWLIVRKIRTFFEVRRYVWLLHLAIFLWLFFQWKNIQNSLKKSFFVTILLLIFINWLEKALRLIAAS